MPSVYSLAFPETNRVFDEVVWPDHLYRVGATKADFDEFFVSVGLPALDVDGEKKLGLLDLAHEPILDGVVAALAPHLPGLGSFGWRYPLAGSGAGIGMLCDHVRNTGATDICVLEGDYEGYAAQAALHGLDVRVIPLDDAPAIAGSWWFIANPSPVDGGVLPEGFLEELCAHNDVVIDVAYAGLHGPTLIPIPSAARAVLWSLSKPWGLFWRRVGMLVTDFPTSEAYATRWFKDPQRLLAAYETVTAYSPHAMADRYRYAQTETVHALRAVGFDIEPSSTLLLALVQKASTPPALWSQVAHCERIAGSGQARLCLSPLMEELIFN